MASRFLAPFTGGRGLIGRDPFLDLHREVNRLFDDTFRSFGDGQGGRGGSMPRLDIHEAGNALEVTAELPGVSQNDLDLRIEGDILTISGEKRNQREDKNAHISERSYGTFQRSIQLPFTPNPDQVQANFRDGVLTVAIPREAQQDRSRRIQIGGGQQTLSQDQQRPESSSSSRGGSGGTSDETSAFNFGRSGQEGGQGQPGSEKGLSEERERTAAEPGTDPLHEGP